MKMVLALWAAPVWAAVIDAGATCASLQAALNAAAGGDVVELAAGRLFDCGTTTLTLPVHSGNAFVTVRTSAYRNLPPQGTRICPAGSTAAAPTISYPCAPNIQSSGGAAGSTGGDLAIIQFTPNFITGLQARLGARNWRFVGLEIRGESTVLWSTLFSLDLCGAPGGTKSGVSSSTVRDRAHAIEIDRCWIHGYYDRPGPQKAVQADGSAIVIRDSVIAEFKAAGQDGQGVFTRSGPGPITVVNTFLAGGAENLFTGGAGSNWPGAMPALITFVGNYSTRDTRWWRLPWSDTGTNGVNPQGPCTSGRWILNTNTSTWWQCVNGQWLQGVCGQPGQPACPNRPVYSVLKNLLEFKAVKTARVEGNLFDQHWYQSGQAAAVLIPNATPGQNGYDFMLLDVAFRFNRISRASSAIAMGAAQPGYRPGDGMRIEHNLFDAVMMPERRSILSGYAGASFIFLTGPQMEPFGTVIRHNTAINSAWPTSYLGWYNTFGLYGAGTAHAYCRFCQVLDNVLPWNNNPITGESGPPVNTFFGTSGQHYWNHGRAAGNVFAKEGRTPSSSYLNDYKAPCCEGNRIVDLMSDVLDGAGRVKPPYKGLATDGSDPGADMDSLWALSGEAASGRANPYLQFRLGSWTATATDATLYYQTPGGEASPASCTVRVSESETLTPAAGAVSQSAAGPARAAILSGLSPATLYYVAVTCGQMTRRATLRTRP